MKDLNKDDITLIIKLSNDKFAIHRKRIDLVEQKRLISKAIYNSTKKMNNLDREIYTLLGDINNKGGTS